MDGIKSSAMGKLLIKNDFTGFYAINNIFVSLRVLDFVTLVPETVDRLHMQPECYELPSVCSSCHPRHERCNTIIICSQRRHARWFLTDRLRGERRERAPNAQQKRQPKNKKHINNINNRQSINNYTDIKE